MFTIFLNAINIVEVGNAPNRGCGVVGDSGRAIGPFQIWKSYYNDAKKHLERINYPTNQIPTYQECHEYDKASIIVWAYMLRYAPRAMANNHWEKLARIHNGGPIGFKKSGTKGYWNKVNAVLEGFSQEEPPVS